MKEGERAPLLREFTTMEKLVVTLVARGVPYAEIGVRLHVNTYTVKYHVTNAAAKIPGDLPAGCKIMFWSRGATLQQLEGGNWIPQSPSKTDMREAKARPQEYPVW